MGAQTKSLRFAFVLALTFASLSSLHAAAASARPGAPKIDANAALQPPRRLAERYDVATAANSANLDKARSLEEEEELPSHLGGGADSSANSVKLDKARGGGEEEEEGFHWAMGATTNDRAGSNPASNSAADRAAEPVAGSKPGGGYFSGWTKGLSNSFSNAGTSFTNGVINSVDAARKNAISASNSFAEGVQNSAAAARDAADYVANNPANTAAGLVVGGVAGGLMAGAGTIARHAHTATMEEIGSFGAGGAGVAHLPVLGQPQP
ncbi:unnamed protein product [Closterium sp. Naga37s-1]|nr:unnamed protein product [Closterium sp. Naga37s-1]